LKYGARLINSYLGDNSTISCCEVLNSLIFPAHEQHHNNSFLCAALVAGQSNVAAGATIGSNHNSRGADGELVAGRGFWPGLCVSLKHNSKFASFTLLAKGDYPCELNIPIPFSLVNNDVSNDKLVIMPGYWFMYNMYALARNVTKHITRDKRTDKTQLIEYDWLAPDSINEMFEAIEIMKRSVAKAWALKNKKTIPEKEIIKKGKQLLESDAPAINDLEILAEGFENSHRKVQLIKVAEAYHLFKEIITYYGITELINYMEEKKLSTWRKIQDALPAEPVRNSWKNIGGQLMPESSITSLIKKVRSGAITSWDEVHDFYKKKTAQYEHDKFQHAMASFFEILGLTPKRLTKKNLLQLIHAHIATKEWMTNGIYESRAKDYSSAFRKMVYDSPLEMEKVIGKLSDNSFIAQQKEALHQYKLKVETLVKQLS
jgi:hypothetical protein